MNFFASNKDFFQAIGPLVIAGAAIFTVWKTSRIHYENREHDKTLKNQDILIEKYEKINELLGELSLWLEKLPRLKLQPSPNLLGIENVEKFTGTIALTYLSKMYLSSESNKEITLLVDETHDVHGIITSSIILFINLDEPTKTSLEIPLDKKITDFRLCELVDISYNYFQLNANDIGQPKQDPIFYSWQQINDRSMVIFANALKAMDNEVNNLPIKSKLSTRV